MKIAIEVGEFNELCRPGWEWHCHPDVVVGRHLNSRVAALRLFPRILSSKSIKLAAIGIGGVFTKEEFRSRGYATELIRWTLRRSEGKFACACLFSARGRLDNLYCKAGFYPLKNFDHGTLYATSITSNITLRNSVEWELDPPDHF